MMLMDHAFWCQWYIKFWLISFKFDEKAESDLNLLFFY
jgi:hypothetical protein